MSPVSSDGNAVEGNAGRGRRPAAATSAEARRVSSGGFGQPGHRVLR